MPGTLAPNVNAGFDGSEPAISRFWASYAAIWKGSRAVACPRIASSAWWFWGPWAASRPCTSVRIASCVAVVWAAAWSEAYVTAAALSEIASC